MIKQVHRTPRRHLEDEFFGDFDGDAKSSEWSEATNRIHLLDYCTSFETGREGGRKGREGSAGR